MTKINHKEKKLNALMTTLIQFSLSSTFSLISKQVKLLPDQWCTQNSKDQAPKHFLILFPGFLHNAPWSPNLICPFALFCFHSFLVLSPAGVWLRRDLEQDWPRNKTGALFLALLWICWISLVKSLSTSDFTLEMVLRSQRPVSRCPHIK